MTCFAVVLLVACRGGADHERPSSDSEETAVPPDSAHDSTGDTAGDSAQESVGDSGGDSTPDTAPQDADGDGAPVSVDCDDGDPSVHPGAEENPSDAVDDDCDGWVDLDAATIYTASAYWQGIEGDYRDSLLGLQGVAATDLDGDGAAEVLATTYEHLWALGDPWRGGEFLAADVDARASLTNNEDTSGVWSAFGPGADLDGDGIAEVLAVVEADDGGRRRLEAGVYGGESLGAGDADGTGPLVTLEVSDDFPLGVLRSSASWDTDLDGDGLADLVLGMPSRHGSVGDTLVVLADDMPVGATLRDDEAAVRLGDHTDGGTGATVRGASDLNGDGTPELVVSAGGLWILDGAALGRARGTMEPSSLALGRLAFERAPLALVAPGDLDGDGLVDLLVGTDTTSSATPAGSHLGVWLGLGAGGTWSDPSEANAWVGFSGGQVDNVAGPGLLRAGGADIVVGAGTDGDWRTFLVPVAELPVSGTLDLAPRTNFIRARESVLGEAGLIGALVLADLDGDGDDDIAAGNGAWHVELGGPGSDLYPAGIVSIFGNPR